MGQKEDDFDWSYHWETSKPRLIKKWQNAKDIFKLKFLVYLEQTIPIGWNIIR